MSIKSNKSLDCAGLSCPMPIVKTKKAMDEMNVGEVLEVIATDRGSVADLQGWAKRTGHQYIGTLEEGDLLKHYLRKSDPNEVKEEVKFPHVIKNEELQEKLGSNITIIDVREPAEYTFNHIPNAISIPLAELENSLDQLNKDDEIYVVCRTGNRSDLACQTLAEKGFANVKNVVPGMSEWAQPVESK